MKTTSKNFNVRDAKLPKVWRITYDIFMNKIVVQCQWQTRFELSNFALNFTVVALSYRRQVISAFIFDRLTVDRVEFFKKRHLYY